MTLFKKIICDCWHENFFFYIANQLFNQNIGYEKNINRFIRSSLVIMGM